MSISTNGFEWLVESGLILLQAVPIILAGWFLWMRRQKDCVRRLRHALLSEIKQTPTYLVSLIAEGNQHLESTIYESSAEKIDLLTNDEIEALINYSTADLLS